MLVGIIIVLLIACAISVAWTDGITRTSWSEIDEAVKKNDK